MATFKYLIQYSKANENKPANIRVHFRLSYKFDCYARTGKKILPEYWQNPTKGESGKIKNRVVFKDRDILAIYLNDLRTFIENEEINTPDKFQIDSSWLKLMIDKFNYPEKYEEKKLSLFEFIEKFINESKKRINPDTGRLISDSTLKKYTTCFNYLKDFAAKKNRTIDFIDIDLEFYDDFVEFLSTREKIRTLKDGKLKKEIGLSTNTIGKQIAILKAFMNAANEEGHTTNTNHRKKRFKTLTEETEAIYLTEQDLQNLYELDLTNNPKLDRVRDVFLLGAWTGCRFSDLDQIHPRNINGQMIKIKQYKTDHKVTIPLYPVVISILKKYGNDLPRVLTNQKMNKYLKDLGQLAGLNEPFHKKMTIGGKRVTKKFKKWELLCTHTARRSFATNLYLDGFPAISIMKITGHETEKAFLKYIKVTPDEHANKLLEHWQNRGVYLKIAK